MIEDLHGTTIRIGAIDWTVSIEDRLDEDDRWCLGITRWGPQVLGIRREMHQQTQLQTLFHEIMHAILRQGGVDSVLQDGRSEAVAESAGYGLMALFRDNPDLVRMLVDRVSAVTKT